MQDPALTKAPGWIAWAVVATLVVTLAGGYWLYRDQETTLRSQAETELEATAELKAAEMARWRAERLEDARRLVSAPGARGLMIAWLQAPTDANLEPVLETLESLRHGDRYADILLVSTDGETLASASGDVAPLHPEANDALDAALAAAEPVFTDFHDDATDDPPHLDVIAPILSSDSPDAHAIAAVVFRIDAAHFLYPLIQAWPTRSETAETLLVRRDGDDVLFLNEVRHAADAALTLRQPLSNGDMPAVKAALGERGILAGTDYRGHRVLAYVSEVQGSPWLMISKVDESEALANWRVRSRYIVGLFVVLASAVLAAPALVVQRMHAAELQQDNARLETLVDERTADLHRTAEELAMSNEQLEATVEELQNANEELQVTSEELQMTGEDLQASNEELQATGEELLTANRELAAASEAKTQFLRAMSHELRTPLNSIIGFSDLLSKGLTGDISDEQRRQLELINRSGRHLLALINDILDLSRIEAGRVDIAIEEFDLRALTEELVDSVRPSATAKQLDLTFEVAGELPPLVSYRSDRRRIGQVLLNLLGNAVKFTDAGSVSTRLFSHSPGTIGISVTDTGPGIPWDEWEPIFGEFVQGASVAESGVEGTGLGLAISRGLAQVLGGTLTLESGVGRGSTFTLLLPEEPGLSERAD